MSYPQFPVPDLHLIGVADPGIPGQERVVIRPNQEMGLAGYGLTLAIPSSDGRASPIFDSCYWFPEIRVRPPCWILVFTGRGTPKWSEVRGEDVLSLHWQRPYTVFGSRRVVPVLFGISGASVGKLID